MSKKIEKVLIVDDDKESLLIISKALELNGCHVKTAVKGMQALVMAEKEHYDVFIIDTKLPDMTGTQLLAQIHLIHPKAVKIIITNSPTIENAAESVNKGANAYYLKPVNPETLLSELKEKLKVHNAQKLGLDKKKDWVKQRISKIQLNEYLQFAEETATLFGVFGLSKTQAKIYMALNALGVATASEVAVLSKIRREEVYRIMPELENRGIITSRLEAPRKFAATEPKTALNILVKMKVEEIDREMLTLQQRKEELISRLLNTSFGIYEENSVEALSRQVNVDLRLSQMARKAKNQILLVGSIEDMKKIISETQEVSGQIKMRTIVGEGEFQDETGDSEGERELRLFLTPAGRGSCSVDLRFVGKRVFNLVIVDGHEAIWGESKLERVERKVLWTNDPVQVGILRRAFENLWQEAVSCECDGEVRMGSLV
ncbi:MAG: response regulator [Candidatus Bathyarchaeia archaeon]|jgi:CheY-like chemotaxis protein